MKCDIIIPIWNEPEITKTCIEHIIKNTCYPYRLILIDNASDLETRNYLESLNRSQKVEVYLIRNEENLGFVKAVNQGLKISDTPYVCILNNDTLPGTGWLDELIHFAEEHPDAGLLNPLCNGHIQHNMTVDEYALYLSSANKGKYMEMNQCQGFCMLIKREVIDKVGFLDEVFGMGGFDDTDYSMRAHLKGFRSICVYSSYVYHREHKSFNRMGERKLLQRESETEYFKKWPRHLRIMMIYSISKYVNDDEIANFLKSSLFFAQKWCWVNLLIFGDSQAKNRIENIKKNISFPLHQNIKFSYLNNMIKPIEISMRILERSFGTKKRKKYDAIIYTESRLRSLIGMLCNIQKCHFELVEFSSYPETRLNHIVESLRGLKGKNIKCDIILPVCDQYEFTKKCIESILKNTDSPFRLIVINNGRNPDTKKYLENLVQKKDIEITVINNKENIGWVKALNKGIELSDSPYICFQNDDTIVTKGWLRKMIDILEKDEDFGLINPTWEGRLSNVPIDRYNDMLEKKKSGRFVETDWCRGFCVVIKRSVVEKIGQVDEDYGLAYFDDVDYSVRAIEAGFLPLKALDTYVYHHRNATFFEILKGEKWNELHEKNKLIYYKKWGRPLRISLILDKENFKNDINRIISTSFYLARKQHRIYIWSPINIHDRFLHTNIVFRRYPSLISKLFMNLYLNNKKVKEKKYDAVFVYNKRFKNPLSSIEDGNIFYDDGKDDFNNRIINTVNRMKEETKENINV